MQRWLRKAVIHSRPWKAALQRRQRKAALPTRWRKQVRRPRAPARAPMPAQATGRETPHAKAQATLRANWDKRTRNGADGAAGRSRGLWRRRPMKRERKAPQQRRPTARPNKMRWLAKRRKLPRRTIDRRRKSAGPARRASGLPSMRETSSSERSSTSPKKPLS